MIDDDGDDDDDDDDCECVYWKCMHAHTHQENQRNQTGKKAKISQKKGRKSFVFLREVPLLAIGKCFGYLRGVLSCR